MLSTQHSRSEEPSVSTSATTSSTISTTVALEQIKDKLVEAQETLKKIAEVEAKSKSFQTLKPTPLDIDDLVALDRAHQHLLWLDVITKTLEKSTACKKDHDLLISCHQILVSVVESLIDSSCLNLRNYALKSLIYLRSTVLPGLELELEADLEALNYPKCVLGLDDDVLDIHDVVNKKKLQKVYSVLDEIQLPEKLSKQFELTNVDPAMVILRPLKKRFKFHFFGTKKTNNPIKPEWYLQQVGSWLKGCRRFFHLIVEPVDKSGTSFQRFSYGLGSQVLKKLQKDIVAIMYDDITLSHMIDEILTFSQEFYNLNVAPDILPLVVLLEPTIFQKWLTLERKFAFAKIDDMMLDEQSWTQSSSKLEVSKCTETFVVLLQSITNRFKNLSANVECQLQFVQLQSDLLEDMRLRLAQIVRLEQNFPLSSKYCLILNSSQYLIDVMNSWSGIPLYLQLELAKYGEDHYSGLFKEVIDGFDFLVQDLIKNLAEHMYYEVKSRSKMYKDIKWFAYQLEDQDQPCHESLPMFQILASQVDQVDKFLMSNLAGQVVTQVCEHLSGFYIHDIILVQQFSQLGSFQIKVDVEKGMNAIFAQHHLDQSKLEAFHQLQDVIKILTMKQANAILLLESLSDAKQVLNSKDILNDVGIFHVDCKQSLKILKRRVDLK